MNSATTSVQTFFDDYAEALLSFSPEKIASFYTTPMAVYSDNGVQLVDSMDQVVAFWGEGVKPYKKMNIDTASPQILTEDQLSEKVLVCKVLWQNKDKSGQEVGAETNFYILSDNDGSLHISGLVIMGQ